MRSILILTILSLACFELGVVAGARATVAPGGKLVTIGLVADSHYDTFPAGEKAPWEPLPNWFRGQVQRTTTTTKRRYDIAKDKMDESIGVFNAIPEMTLVVNLGDLVNNDMMWNLPHILDRFNEAKAPKYHLLGNHDLRAHNDRFGKLNKTQADWVRNKFGLNEWYYAVDHAPFTFIFIDSMVLEPESNDQKKKKEHMDWFQGKLNEAKDNKRVVILFAHIPIGFQTNILAPILKTYDHIALAFFGHDHKGGYLIQGKTHCVTLNGQIETMVNAFAVVEVFVDRAELTGFGRVPTRIMTFTPETRALIEQYDGPVVHDLALQGNQPLPPKQLWRNEVLQKPPPLMLNIPTYRKPLLPTTEPNPGDTRFLKDVYRLWPKRIRVPSREDTVDLTSGVKDKPPTLYSPGPAGLATASSNAYAPSSSYSDRDEPVPIESKETPREAKVKPVLTTSYSTPSEPILDHSVFVVGYMMLLPVVLTIGGAILLLLRRRRTAQSSQRPLKV
ncbi:serine threonine protein phosphatase, putative [Bodo saltans]|uniref:Serine threonine protein phosphatase, putative n=1 Tax=Bodo saltans TaxID=75058 RepID=A0A0S4J4X8_BODSA|nr:serine threonine protein phosphatase, putative [Bodo saltans]|eukprot:CUG82370.1 serine threonine protein phosphatase, putative [Bodo saltans]